MIIFQDIKWIRSNSDKLCPALRKEALEWYRPIKHLPCFMQKYFKTLKQRWRKLSVIVELSETRAGEFNCQEVARLAGCSVLRELKLMNAFSTKVTAKSLELLIQNPNVKRVIFDREVKAVLDVASPIISSSALWEQGYTGAGVTVAVVDTGIYKHQALEGRLLGFKDFINQKTDFYDDNGHGTHVAGDVAASSSQLAGDYQGPAPGAKLVGVKVLDKMGSGSLSTVISGVEWCIENRDIYDIQVINLSLGAAAVESYKDDIMCQAVEKAWNAGIVVCAAAGNDGPEQKTIGTPGIDPLVITVGAMDDKNSSITREHTVADFSSRGPTIDGLTKPDLLAPGVNIISLRSPRSMLDKKNKQTRVGDVFTSLSGTSMATPVCAGVVAQLLQSNQSLTPEEVKNRLKTTAIPMSSLDANTQGAGVINAQAAVNAVLGMTN